MAEYYPLISRAVAGLRAGTPETRRAIYDRARQALIGQLRAMDPPVPEEAIARETAALDDAIARAEAEIGGAAEPAMAKAQPRPAPSPASEGAPTPATPSADRPSLAARRGLVGAPSLGGAKRDAEPRADAPAPKPQAPAPLMRPPTPRSPLVSTSPEAVPPAGAKAETAPPVKPDESGPPPEGAPAMPAAAALRVEPVAPSDAEADDGDDPRIASARDRSRDDAARPAAPRPPAERRSKLRVWIVTVAALAAVVAIAVTAWRLRDNPAELTRAAPVQTAQTAPDKIAERADDAGASAVAPAAVATDETARTTTDAAPAPGAPTSAGGQPAVPSGSLPVTTAPAGQPASQAQTEALLPIAYKAAILIDAPDTPEKVKTYVGTVVWHAQSVPTGQGQPLGMAVQADVSIPDANVQLMMQIRRNTESQLPASHTIDLKFTIGADSPVGSIKQVSVPQMRQQDMPTGDALAGIPVTIADNYFLVGLVRGAAEDHNLDLLRSRPWIDIPLLLGNGKASKITFEKGANGGRIFNDVIDSWKAAQN